MIIRVNITYYFFDILKLNKHYKYRRHLKPNISCFFNKKQIYSFSFITIDNNNILSDKVVCLIIVVIYQGKLMVL